MAEINTVKKPGFGDRVKRFFRDNKSEFLKIKWPSPKDTLNKFIIVMIAIIAIAVVLWGLDWLFNQGILLLANLG